MLRSGGRVTHPGVSVRDRSPCARPFCV
jgi:hypothetical protein